MTVEIHSYRLAQSTFSFIEGVSLSRNTGGKVIAAVEYADPHLRASFETPRLTIPERHPWEAWKDSLRGGLNSFLAYDVSRAEPLAYPGGIPEILDASWNGQGIASSLSAHVITASLQAAAPSDLTMTAGDHIGLIQSGRYWIGTVAETATASSSSIAVAVNPAVPLNIFSAATVVFWRPRAEFILISSSWSNPVDMGFAPISFEAVQKI